MAKPKRKAAVEARCPCGSGLALSDCCGAFLSGGSAHFGAPTPEALMRSRYTAYALGDDAYVLGTWAPETRPETLYAPGDARPKWLKLKVLSSAEALDGRTGEVLFEATGRTAAGAFRMKEHSLFRREEGGRWLYVSGESPDAEATLKD